MFHAKIWRGKKKDLPCDKQWFYLLVHLLPHAVQPHQNDMRNFTMSLTYRFEVKAVSHFSFLSGAYPPKDNGIYSFKRQGYTVYLDLKML